MNKKRLAIIGLGVTALVGLTIAGSAAAAPPLMPANSTDGQYYCPGHGYGVINQVSKLTGLTVAEIQAQLQQGKSLVEIAATNGVTDGTLVNAILEPMKQMHQQAIAAGYITQAQSDQMIQWMEQQIRQVLNTKGFSDGVGMMGGGMMQGMMGQGGMMGGGMMGESFGGGMMGGMHGGWGINNTSPRGTGWGGMMGGWGF
ncbi:MAG: hypothetical protein HY667_00255 [Chloroflexi bacterium]|nr:hypothetical protein [Chloroflexota bacterium]